MVFVLFGHMNPSPRLVDGLLSRKADLLPVISLGHGTQEPHNNTIGINNGSAFAEPGKSEVVLVRRRRAHSPSQETTSIPNTSTSSSRLCSFLRAWDSGLAFQPGFDGTKSFRYLIDEGID